MDHYIDIQLMPDAEISATILMNAVYSKFHKVLWDRSSVSIGVSFPKYNKTLGSVLRIHGSEPELLALNDINWLGNMVSYCNISGTQPIPAPVKFRTVSRKQPTMSQSKLNRLIKRGTINEEQANEYRMKMLVAGLGNPYVELKSSSNGERHRRYIQFGELLDAPVAGHYDHFGLSKTATIPWF